MMLEEGVREDVGSLESQDAFLRVEGEQKKQPQTSRKL